MRGLLETKSRLRGVRFFSYRFLVKLGPRTSAWRVEDIRALMERINTASIAYD